MHIQKVKFLMGFLKLECEADKNVSIILGSPFLATSRTLIDVQQGEFIIKVNDQQITLNVLDAMKRVKKNKD